MSKQLSFQFLQKNITTFHQSTLQKTFPPSNGSPSMSLEIRSLLGAKAKRYVCYISFIAECSYV